MREYEQIIADATPGSPFSNMTQFEYWAPRWCWSCKNDDDETEKYCPILSASLMSVTPREWTTLTAEDDLHGNYTCTEYEERRDGNGGGDPEPEPEPPPVIEGQIDIFEVFVDKLVDRLPERERTPA
jgi:hypothetical protein